LQQAISTGTCLSPADKALVGSMNRRTSAAVVAAGGFEPPTKGL
jgi:hypothetical protein